MSVYKTPSLGNRLIRNELIVPFGSLPVNSMAIRLSSFPVTFSVVAIGVVVAFDTVIVETAVLLTVMPSVTVMLMVRPPAAVASKVIALSAV